MRGSRVAGLLGLMVGMAVLTVAPARGSVSVAPSVVEGALEPGARLGPIRVVNTGAESLRAQVELVWLTHDPEGRPIFLEDAGARERARAVLEPSWNQAVLAPRAAQELYFTVTPVGAGLPSAYPAALVRVPVPTGTLRVAVLFLLRRREGAGGGAGPGGPAAGDGAPVRVQAVWADQEVAGGPIELVAEVVNPGTGHVRPRMHARVAGPEGGTVGWVTLQPAVVLPGAARRLRGYWAPPVLPPGRYALAVVPGEPGQKPAALAEVRPVAQTAFEVISPYRLAVVRGRLQLSVVGLPPAGDLRVQAAVYNEGNTPVTPQLRVDMARDGHLVASRLAAGPAVGPGEVGTVVLPWPDGMGPGHYVMSVAWVHEGRVVATDSLSVAAEPAVATLPTGGVAP